MRSQPVIRPKSLIWHIAADIGQLFHTGTIQTEAKLGEGAPAEIAEGIADYIEKDSCACEAKTP